MKRLLFNSLIFLLSISFSFLISPVVFADEYTSTDVSYYLDSFFDNTNYSYTEMKNYINSYSDIILDIFEDQYSVYDSTYSSSYPYYRTSLFLTSDTLQFEFRATSSIPVIPFNSSTYNLPYDLSAICTYNISTGSLNSSCDTFTVLSGSNTFYSHNNSGSSIYANRYFFSNFDLYFSDVPTNHIIYNTVSNPSITKSWSLESTSPLTPLYDYFELTFLNEYDTDTYEEVDLNNYAYLVLSLKDYNNLISPVVFDVLGQICITPVYDYGQKEKPNGVTDRCSLIYENYTPIRYYLLNSDLTNHSVFYIAPYSQSITNKIKINTRIFNISYISQYNASEPVALINGRSYPVLPYSSLSSSSQINEDNNYIPGQSENVFDITSDSSFIDNLFSNPLNTLTDVWKSIISMFALIGAFIGLLPVTLQAFLYTALALGLSIGLIKIIL